MRLYEVAQLPVKIGIQPVKWFGGLVVNQATETARANIIEIWRRPWEKEVHEHLLDAREQRDFSRADEQRTLEACIEHYAPQTAEEFEELVVHTSDTVDKKEIDEILGP